MEVDIGGTWYRLFALESDHQWIARAFRVDTGERFGVDAIAPTRESAVSQLRGWLEWHHDHAAALAALRAAERAYHRAVTGEAFGGSAIDRRGAGGTPMEELDRARAALDAVRARRPM
jgi:hypothetical protein